MTALTGLGLLLGCGPGDRTLLDSLQEGLRGRGGPRGHHPRPHPEPNPPPQNCPAPQDADDVYALVTDDLAVTDSEDQPFRRYVTFANQANALGCDYDAAASARALNKFLNSLSINARITQAVAIDADSTLYRIDLRDIDWDRPVNFGGTPAVDVWEGFIASTPYAVPFVGDEADSARSDTGTAVPVLFADVLISEGMDASAYYPVLDIPNDADDFIADQLGIDVAGARAAGETIRAGFIGDSGRAFIAERFEIQAYPGALWQISELGCNRRTPRCRAALFDDPLVDPSGERELVFNLPNGLQGHALAAPNGDLLAVSSILRDDREPDSRARIAQSFFRRRAQGVELSDEVRPFAENDPDGFSPEELEAILALYPDAQALASQLGADNALYANALADAGVDIEDSPEPVSAVFSAFSGDVDAAAAAGALYVSEDLLEDELSNLDPSLAPLGAGDSIERETFDALYLHSLCILSVVLENQPETAICEAVFQ